MDSQLLCTICNEPGHHPRKCPVLHEMLKEGFYSGGGSGGGHTHDDDEKMTNSIAFITCPSTK